MYTDFKADESYTPNRLSILVGNDFNDLHEIEVKKLIKADLYEEILWNLHEKRA